MTAPLIPRNPAFLTPDRLHAGFVARQHDLELILDTVRQNTDRPANQQLLIIAGRGAGKTMLALRAAGAVREDPALSQRWEPVIWSEEAWHVGTAGEFWLETLLHVGDQTGDPRWVKAHEELLDERDEKRLEERALARLMDFADEQGKRLLVVVENLQMVLGEQMADRGGDAAWTLRHTLMNEPRIMLLATCTGRFAQISKRSEALFEMFLEHHLEPLTREECRVLWQRASGVPLSVSQARPIEILTGGNARLLGILASFAVGRTFAELLHDLTALVDEHTDYFKSNFLALSGAERRVLSALAGLWAPSYAKEVARRARVGVNEASRDLGRLEVKGVVRVVGEKGRAKLYQVNDRLFGIYHMMRHHGGPTWRLRAAVEFMVAVYDEDVTRLPKQSTYGATTQEPQPLFLRERAPRGLVEGWDAPASAAAATHSNGFGYACLLAEAGQWFDALDEVSYFLDDPSWSTQHLAEIVRFFVDAAAAGQAAEALAVLQRSSTADLAEPLITALQLEAGQAPRVPQEILEVAEDLVARVRSGRLSPQ